MKIIKSYCGRTLCVLPDGNHAIYDRYARQLVFVGNKDACEKEFNAFMQRVINKWYYESPNYEQAEQIFNSFFWQDEEY